jgi:hypothetical protein
MTSFQVVKLINKAGSQRRELWILKYIGWSTYQRLASKPWSYSVEGTFIGSRRTECLKNEIIERYVAVVRTEPVTKSIHDHFADTEPLLGLVIALYPPEVHTFKTKELLNINPKARKDVRDEINRIPEGAVSYWKTGTTGKRIGHHDVIASEVSLGKRSNGFSKMMMSFAFESLCSLDI